MITGQPHSIRNLLNALIAGFFILCLASCAVLPKNYPRNKPFVYDYNVDVIDTTGILGKDAKIDLKNKLTNQLDDSIKVRRVTRLFYKGLISSVLHDPPVYDPANADKSVLFMRALLNSLGYFSDSISYKVDTVFKNPDKYEATVNFAVIPGKQVVLDSIRYNLKDSSLQKITDEHKNEAFIKKGDPFAKATISAELDRLVDLYRDHGYVRFTKDELKGYWDTLNLALLNPSLDPFEQIRLLDSIRRSQINPKANLEIRLRQGFDTSKLRQYYIGNVTVYPDLNADTVEYQRHETTVNGVRVVYYRRLFKPKILPPNIYFHHGELYNQSKYFKTINRFSSLGSWNLVSIDTARRGGGEDTVDFHIRLSPAKKYSFSTTLEGSRNQSVISGNLFGIAINFGLQNRNFAKAADQANTNARYGIELGSNKGQRFIQTQQIVLSHNIYFPRPILIRQWLHGELRENAKSFLSVNAASTDRRDLYNLGTFNGSVGWDLQKGKTLMSLRLLNIEFSNLKPRSGLTDLFNNNPALKNIFTDGFIQSFVVGVTATGGKNKNIHIIRGNFELAGFPSSIIKSKFMDTNLYRFVKLDGEFTKKFQIRKSALALRFFGGFGYEFPSTVNPLKKNNLPFFKEYFAGGPNSMRAWGLRRLGPGSVIKEFSGNAGIPERYGDIQIETNIEYRFPIANISGVLLNGALFTDVGNIWLQKKSAGLPEEVFKLGRLWEDLAIGSGAGLRVDFSFFVLRFDYAYKVKDPSPAPADAAIQNKFFGYKFFKGTQFQLGVTYPFIL